MRTHEDIAYAHGKEAGIECAAEWHDKREQAMRDLLAANPNHPDSLRVLERANWHRDAAKIIRELQVT